MLPSFMLPLLVDFSQVHRAGTSKVYLQSTTGSLEPTTLYFVNIDNRFCGQAQGHLLLRYHAFLFNRSAVDFII